MINKFNTLTIKVYRADIIIKEINIVSFPKGKWVLPGPGAANQPLTVMKRTPTVSTKSNEDPPGDLGAILPNSLQQ